jgi:hypothetical protein
MQQAVHHLCTFHESLVQHTDTYVISPGMRSILLGRLGELEHLITEVWSVASDYIETPQPTKRQMGVCEKEIQEDQTADNDASLCAYDSLEDTDYSEDDEYSDFQSLLA